MGVMNKTFAFDDIALISVTYNSAHLAEDFAKTACMFRNVWIVDNDSKDNTTLFFQRFIAHAKIISQPKNIGFGPANNFGFKASLGTCRMALFLNPDCFIEKNSIRLLIEILEKYPEAAIASPIVFSKMTHGANLKFRNYSSGYLESNTQSLQYSSDLPEIIKEACLDGACFLVNSKKFESMGAFDEELFMYSEEDDISMRTQLKGYSKITARDAHAQHLGGASSTMTLKIELRKKYHQRWSSYYMINKYKSSSRRLLSVLKTLIVAPPAIMLYSLTAQKKHLLKWVAWTFAALDGIFMSKIFRKIL